LPQGGRHDDSEGETVPEKHICVVIPALNEEATLSRVLEEIPRESVEGMGYRVETVVVDNNSTDRTGQVAEESGARVILEPVKGKGRAINTAFACIDADFVFILDGDFTYPATHITEMLKVLEGGYDVVLGSRLKGQIEDGAMSRLNMVGNHLLAFMASLLYGTRVSDLCTGCWGFRGAVVKDMRLDAVGFELEAAMFIDATRKGYRIAEVPIGYRRRKSPPKLRSVRDGLRIGRKLIGGRFRGR
jgi:glycosyltransferase involved in cell wall biosynthesis